MIRVMMVLNGVIGGANRSAADLVRNLPGDRYQGCIVHPEGLSAGLDVLRAATPRIAGAYLPRWKRTDQPLLQRIRERISRNVRSGFHLRSGWQLRCLCRSWNVGLIHTNTSSTLTPALVARALGLPHVWHIRELIGARNFRYFENDRLTAKTFSLLSDRIIANSEQAAAFFRNHLGARSVTVIPNGIAEPESDPAAAGQKLRQSLRIPQSAIVIGMVASLSSRVKNHRHVLDAVAPILARRPNVFFVLYGDAPNNPYADGVRTALRALGNRAILAGYVGDPWAIMASIDILAHGTPNESFGRVFVEAMLAAKPVAAPRGGGALSIVSHGETGFLTDPDDARDLERRLTLLADDASLRARFGDAGRTRARAEFSLSAYVRAVCRVYDEVLSGDAVQRPLRAT
jgi:glycosyltransferase involved in cell wall biosynthesis